MTRAHPARLRHPRLEHARHHHADRGDRPPSCTSAAPSSASTRVAYAPHRAVDVQALDVDYYVFSFYKTYGPHYAVMYGRHDWLLELDGLYHYFYGQEKVLEKLDTGNTNYELVWGARALSTTSSARRRGWRPGVEQRALTTSPSTRPRSASACWPTSAGATTCA